ncbi:MAG: DUF1499 domain-containing protein [Pseudomonadota bacterium]
MTVLKYALLALFVFMGLAMAYVRLMPLNEARFHMDPETAERPSVRGHILVRQGADISPPEFELSKHELAQRVEELILTTPRTSRLAGDLTDSFASYVTRSGFWSFPDIASVKIVAGAEGKTQLLILSRQVYGVEDLGVNRARVEGWLSALRP